MIFVINGYSISIGSRVKNYENNYFRFVLQFDLLGRGTGWNNGKNFTLASDIVYEFILLDSKIYAEACIMRDLKFFDDTRLFNK